MSAEIGVRKLPDPTPSRVLFPPGTPFSDAVDLLLRENGLRVKEVTKSSYLREMTIIAENPANGSEIGYSFADELIVREQDRLYELAERLASRFSQALLR